MPACPACHEPNPPRARFCLACGAPLARPAAPEARKVVTVLFADVVGSTALGESLDAEAVRRLMLSYFTRIRAVLEKHGGTVEKFIGDAVMAVFGVPTVHEDDALRATRAAQEIQAALADLAVERGQDGARGPAPQLEWRIGVNTGEVAVGGPGSTTLVTGDAVNTAARLEQAAGPGEVLLGHSTYSLVRDAVRVEPREPLTLKGKARPQPTYRLLDVHAGASGHRRRFDLLFVGRQAETALLKAAADRVSSTRTAHVLTVYGPAGIGKTRLVTEVLAGVADRMTVLSSRCLPYGEAVTFWPIADALARAARLTGEDAEGDRRRLADLVGGRAPSDVVDAVASMIGVVPGGGGADRAPALRRYLAALATDRPVCLVVDDLHLAEPPLVDLLADVARRSRDVALLLVVVARPELVESRPDWGGGVANALSLLLEPLPDAETARLLEAFLGGRAADPGAARAIVAAAGGNPLFLEELSAMLLEEGLLSEVDGRWVATDPTRTLPMPTSIAALLTARTEALPADERDLLGRAAAYGLEFPQAVLADLATEADRPDVAPLLDRLVAREILRSLGPQRLGSAYAFRHVLIRDAVYAGLSRATRADLHERIGRWLERHGGSPQVEFVAHHYEAARAERTALGIVDAEADARAADALVRIAERALRRGDMPAAARLYRTALLRVPADDRRRPALLAGLGRALAESGDQAAAVEVLDEAAALAERAGDELVRIHARITAHWNSWYRDMTGWADGALRLADEADEVCGRLGDHLGLARAAMLRTEVHFAAARYDAAAANAAQAAVEAGLAGDPAEATENRLVEIWSTVMGSTPVREAERRVEEVLAARAGEMSAEARLWHALALARGMRGDAAGAVEALDEAADRFSELGQTYWLATTLVTRGRLAGLVGDVASAVISLRAAYTRLRDMGDPSASAAAAWLALAQGPGEVAEAADLAEFAAGHSDAGYAEGRVLALLAQAHVAVLRGEVAAAVAAARSAVDLAERTDDRWLLGEALLGLCTAYAAGSAHADAVAAASRAREVFVVKGLLAGLPAATWDAAR